LKLRCCSRHLLAVVPVGIFHWLSTARQWASPQCRDLFKWILITAGSRGRLS
jgi:hypothetical protein